MRKAQGSNPCSSTHTQLRGAMDSVSDFESGGCGFESRRSCCCSTARRWSLARRDRAGHARTRRHGRRVHLRREVRRRELPAPPHGPRRALDGQRRPGHERLPVPRPRPFLFNSVAQWIAYQTSNLGVAGSSPVGVDRGGVCRRMLWPSGLNPAWVTRGAGFRHQSSGVGSNPTNIMAAPPSTDWRNGSASDSSPEGYVFESRIGHS